MRILIYGINFAPEPTGIGKFTGEMAAWLVERGHDVRVVTAPPYYPEWKVSQHYGCTHYLQEVVQGAAIWRCPLYVPPRPSGLKRILHLASFAISSFPVMVRQIFWRPDVVWAVEPALMCVPSAWLAARLAGAKAWLHVQDYEVNAAFELGVVRSTRLKKVLLSLEQWLMNRFDRVSTVSAQMLALLLDKGVPWNRAVLFPNWVDTSFIVPLDRNKDLKVTGTLPDYRATWGISPDTVVCLYSGNIGEKQGLELMIEAARRLKDELSIRFVICGNGAAYQRLRRMAEGLDNIVWMPLQPYEQLNNLLNAADIHLLPQRSRAADLVMPSKLTGIFASGRPVLATAEPETAVYESVQGRGLVVPPGDADAFVDALLELSCSTEKRQELGKAARDYAMQHLDKSVVLTRFEQSLINLHSDCH